MFFIWTLIPALYVIARFILPLSLPMWVRAGLALVLLVAGEFHLLGKLFFGSMFSPEWPEPVMIAQGWLFGSIVMFAGLLLVRDVVSLLLKWLLRKRLPPTSSGVALMVIALVLSGIGVKQAIEIPAVRTVKVDFPDLPPAFEGFKIVQLTDIHSSRLLPQAWVEQVVEKANRLNPDLIVLTGDMSDGTVDRRFKDVEPLSRLQAKSGLYAITGNHEYYFDYAEWMKIYRQLKIPFLQNSHVRIARGDESIVLAGVNDEAAQRVEEPGPDLEQALAGVRPDDSIILLDHRPGSARDNAKHNVKLQLSGHTHGGMIRGLDLLVGPANNGFVSGRYQVGNMTLYVSNGTGLWNGFPLRLGHPSEITELILHRSAAQ
ncbi:metallophosphoesterase [Pseudescherichia sp.]|uniref:metallophosphoesterase n=1 Tax=Pseudescherichia sp. TaxID=2055881 RepID=UPI0028963D3B|nr:metallophosphoesterase [Pseudescherichia sp.]